MWTPDTDWLPPPLGWNLASRQVQVWCFSLERPPATVQALTGLLSAEEKARAERFHFERDMRRFIVAHGALRRILGEYVASPPEQLEFDYGPRGKPELKPSRVGQELHFSLAHSDALGLLAVANDQPLGVDVEQVRPMDDLDPIARRFFSASEYEQLQALPNAERLGAFFDCWTRKEAYLKACGEGLARPLDSFAVSLAPGEPVRFLHIDGEPAKAAGWSLQPLVPAAGYVGAVAVEGQGWRVDCWRWTDEG